MTRARWRGSSWSASTPAPRRRWPARRRSEIMPAPICSNRAPASSARSRRNARRTRRVWWSREGRRQPRRRTENLCRGPSSWVRASAASRAPAPCARGSRSRIASRSSIARRSSWSGRASPGSCSASARGPHRRGVAPSCFPMAWNGSRRKSRRSRRSGAPP